MTNQYLIFVISAIYTNAYNVFQVFHSSKVSRRSSRLTFQNFQRATRFPIALSPFPPRDYFTFRIIVTHSWFQLTTYSLNNLDQSTRVSIFSLARSWSTLPSRRPRNVEKIRVHSTCQLERNYEPVVAWPACTICQGQKGKGKRNEGQWSIDP